MNPSSIPPDTGLGILSWKGYDSLTASLDSYKQAGFLDIFAEKLVFLPEIEQIGIDIAEKYNIPYAGTPENLGILGGFKAMAEKMTSKYVLLIENDFQISHGVSDVFTPILRAIESLEKGEARMWRFRNLQFPGQPIQTKKTVKYWPADKASLPAKILAGSRRILRSAKAHRLKGMTVYTHNNPAEKFPDVIKQTTSGDYLVRSDVMSWSNNLFLIEREFFLNKIIPEAERNIGGRLINGFPTIETELNRSHWWRDQKFWIGISNPGLFTHDRKGDRGY